MVSFHWFPVSISEALPPLDLSVAVGTHRWVHRTASHTRCPGTPAEHQVMTPECPQGHSSEQGSTEGIWEEPRTFTAGGRGFPVKGPPAVKSRVEGAMLLWGIPPSPKSRPSELHTGAKSLSRDKPAHQETVWWLGAQLQGTPPASAGYSALRGAQHSIQGHITPTQGTQISGSRGIPAHTHLHYHNGSHMPALSHINTTIQSHIHTHAYSHNLLLIA